MELYKNLPIDLVNEVLAYDNRFVIRKGIAYNRLNKEKYEKICNRLLSMPIKTITCNNETNYFWAWIDLDKYMIKIYNNENALQKITYEFRRNLDNSDTYKILNKMILQ